MRTASIVLAAVSCIAGWATVAHGQRVERGVLLAVAADIAKEPGKLLGIGPLPDSAGTRLPHQILVDTSIVCSTGPSCIGFEPAVTMSLYSLVAPAMKAELNKGNDASATSNWSYYRFSEVTVRGDTAEVRVYMSWKDWVAPKSPHIVIALYVLARGPDSTWQIVCKGHLARRECGPPIPS